jgi:hypothetical protein
MRRVGERRVVAVFVAAAAALAVAGVAALMLGFATRGLQDSRSARAELLANGGDAMATIIVVKAPGGEICGLVDMQFTDGSGRTVTATDVQIHAPAIQGQQFRVSYDKNDPTRFEVVDSCGDPNGESRYWLVGVAALGVLVADVALLVMWLALPYIRRSRGNRGRSSAVRAQAGWYPDPVAGGLRWWDGRAWTEWTSPAPTTDEPRPR